MKSHAKKWQQRVWGYSAGTIYYLLAIVLAVFSLGPVLVLLFNSLKSDSELGSNPIGLPLQPLLSNYVNAWNQGNLGVTLLNSVIITTGTIIGIWIIAGLAAYALAHMDLPGGNAVLLYLVICFAIPFQLFLVPLYFLWSSLNLTDNLLGLIIIYWAINSPLAIMLLRSFLISIPRDFSEAARIDGANELQVALHVVMPLSLPGFLTVGLVAGFAAWNEFIYAITFIQDNSLLPVSTSFLSFQQSFHRYWGLTDAAGVIVMLPVIVLFLFLQRRFIEGLAAGGLK
ncbi:sugar ABC transporter permease [Ktedonobacter sp. SOSP1-85]|uniref:carbohydrate ABC transporter permease n=1 Tax=Ktedonobacter sp. SOSP1-85 TaxID=2778367 RepID=UPI0019164326|nr:carbohydrate ABC transporter permease [Ktedonobacter sp. SOSP1-85]GHO73918.1 sugar ABC transporter permease [Ktedonobacter sp. SOSP1-85]